MTTFGRRPTPPVHASLHQSGGADEINITNLSGGLKYTDRGDPDGFDFTRSDFTTDTTWKELDVSSIVPAGTVFILVHLIINSSTPSAKITFMKNGNTYDDNAAWGKMQVSARQLAQDIFISLDSDRKLTYKADNTSWTLINFVIAGWFI